MANEYGVRMWVKGSLLQEGSGQAYTPEAFLEGGKGCRLAGTGEGGGWEDGRTGR